VLKFDKTVPMNNAKVYLRAFTRGLISVDQEIAITICPPTGGNIITKPAATYSPRSFPATSGQTINLASDSMFQYIDYNSPANSLSNANFPAWAIADVYRGCGVF
jgi:hypothetical protein